MKVILFESVPNLGTRGSIVSVNAGYFRNFLSPRKLAVEATEANQAHLADKVKRLERLNEAELNSAKTEAQKIESQTLTFRLKAGEEDKLFGSVTSANIADALAEKGIEIDRHKIAIPEAIKRLGTHTVEVRLHHTVTANLKIVVEKEA
jgi:large subunit ribosomal protein L9